MYIPKFNEETRVPVLDQLMRSHPLATLVTMGASGLFATHLPMVLHRVDDTHATLRGHLSRANAQWREFRPDVQALAIFSGPEHYITPNWYPEKAKTGKVVPTWNYAVVHAYGSLRIIEDPTWLLEHLNMLTNTHEASSPTPWKISDAPEGYVETIAKGIVGIELAIERLEGKWKVSQNQNEQTRASVARGLEALGDEASLAMRDLVNGER
ncbi:FMN-binding negative transcriptional regulator [Edaphobacter flagellatus]|uniref:FMN-binding negative transcriptional regulator n=1 Tax=Edaphobacter flagellatus TaxID=1933044 RepID=UPI0021B4C61E|nr:FMN-binding negative transcriptional regulator [Edaphobacter flagellatus]